MIFGLTLPQWLACLVIVGVMLLVGAQEPERLFSASMPLPVSVPLESIEGLRATGDAVSQLPPVSATSVYLLTQENGEIVFEHNSNTDYAPASTTKLMTALVAREKYPLNKVVTIPAVTFVDDRQPLVPGAQYTVAELLAALLISSNNTAAYALAEAHEGGLPGFVAAMNDTTKRLNLTNSNFTNPAGFDDPNNRSTARDLGQLFRASLRDPILAPLLGSKQYMLHNVDGSPVATLTNTHQLLSTDQRATAGKTGTTDEAKQVLITLLETRSHPYILVVLGSTDRYTETRRLADWVDALYTWEVVQPQNVLQER